MSINLDNETSITVNKFNNQVIVKQASDFGVIDSTKEYFIDGIINMGATQITVPITGITLRGYSFDLSGLTSTESPTIRATTSAILSFTNKWLSSNSF